MIAAQNGHLEMVKLLLEYGANIEEKNYKGKLQGRPSFFIWRGQNFFKGGLIC